jgi:hypothetical protein
VLRLVPFAGGLLLLGLLLPLARRLLPPAEAALALWIAALSPALIYYSNEIKPYGLDALWSVVLALTALRVAEAPERTARWAWLLVMSLGAAAALSPAPFVLAGVTLGLLTVPEVRASQPARRWLPVIVLLSGALFLVIYVQVYRAAAVSSYMQRFWIPYFLSPSLPHLPFKIYNALGSALQAFFTAEGGLWRMWASCLLLVPIGLGLGLLRRRGQTAALVLLVTPLLLAVAASTIRRYPVSPRLLLFALPAAVLLLAAGSGVVAEQLGRWRRLPWLGLVGGAVLALAALDAVRMLREPYEREAIAAPIQRFLAEHQAGATVYVFGRTVPAWVFYTTDWRAPDIARVETLGALVSSEGRAFRHAPSRGNRVQDEGEDLRYPYRDWTELIGASTGMGPGDDGASQGTPDSGWAANEAARIRRAGGPEVWLLFSSYVPGVPLLLDSALTALGGTQTVALQMTGAIGARWVFPDSLRGR